MPLIDRLQSVALPLYGTPYVFGGKDVARDGGLDCSGFIVKVFRDAGVYDFGNPDLTNVQRIAAQCVPVDGPAQPGDLLIFQGTYNNDDGMPEPYSHIGYIKEPQPTAVMVDAHDNRGVGETDYSTSYWQDHFREVLRAPGVALVATDSPWTVEQIAAATGCPVGAVAANWPLVRDALVAAGQGSKASLACAVATTAIETASTFKPVKEAFWLSEAWRQANLRYYPYFGRGLIQLTWEASYRAYGERLGIDLIGNPDLALDPNNAARIFAAYWVDRDIQSMADREDWAAVRKAVQGGDNGLDRLVSIVSTLLES